MTKTTTCAALLGGTMLAVLSTPALAASAVLLVGDRTLVTFDTESLAVTGSVDADVEMLAGIDVRPADGALYGVTGTGAIVTIDPATGTTTERSQLSETLPAGVGAIVDFNPVADRMRLMGTDGTNLRVNVDDGMVTVDTPLSFDPADMHAGETPAIVAAAYTNSFGKPEATAMYDIDATIGALIQQAPPNDGILKAIGKLGIEGAEGYAFDISTTAELENTAYLVSGGALYTVALDTGAATAVGEISGLDGSVRDLAILP